MKNKKAQAAMEFLTTYGWAILILGVVLAGLGYLGVFNPSSYVKSSCQLDAGMACPVFSAYYDGSKYHFDLAIQNDLNDRVTITKIKLTDPQDDTLVCEASPSGEDTLASYGQNQQKDILFEFISCEPFENGLGTKARYDIKLYYKKGDATMPTVTSGKLITIVEDNS